MYMIRMNNGNHPIEEITPFYLPHTLPVELSKRLSSCKTEQEVVDRLEGVAEVEKLLSLAIEDECWCIHSKELTDRLIKKIEGKSEAVHKIQREIQRILAVEQTRYENMQEMIQEGRWEEFSDELFHREPLSEPHRLALALRLAEEKQFLRLLDLIDYFALTSCHELTSIAIQFGIMDVSTVDDLRILQLFFERISKFQIYEPAEAMRLAEAIAKQGNGSNLFVLIDNIDCLPLKQDQRREIAFLLADRDKVRYGIVNCLPLRMVVNSIRNFKLFEADRIALALRLMEKDPADWPVVSSKMHRIAPRNAEARESIARRFLEHPDEGIFSCLVSKIKKFSPSDELIKEIYASVLLRMQFRELANNGDETSFSPSAFALLLKQIVHFPLSYVELRDLAFLAVEKGSYLELVHLLQSISQFALSIEDRLRIAAQIATKEYFGDAYPIRSLCSNLDGFQLPQQGFEKEKFDLAMALASKCRQKVDIRSFMYAFRHIQLESEENRLAVAAALFDGKRPDDLYTAFDNFSEFQLSGESTLWLLRNFRDPKLIIEFLSYSTGVIPELSERDCLHLLTIYLSRLESQESSNMVYYVRRIYQGKNRLIDLTLYQGIKEVSSLYQAVNDAGLGEEVFDELPKLFPEELLDLFSELTQLVRKLIEQSKEQDRQRIAQQLVNLLMCLMMRNIRGELSEEELRSLSPLFSSLFQYRVPEDRLRVFIQAESLLTGKKGAALLPLWNQIQKEIKSELALIPAFVLLHQLSPSALSGEFNEILQLIKSDLRFLKDSKNRTGLIDLIQLLESFSLEEACSLFKALYQENHPKDRHTYVQKVIDLLQFNRPDLVKRIKDLGDIDQQLEALFLEVFGLEEAPGFSHQYASTFGKFRQKNALLSYAIKIRTKFGAGSEQMVQLQRYFHSVLNGTFPGMRYDHKQSEHLKMLFEGREELKAQWTEGERLTTAELTSSLDVQESAEEKMDVDYFLHNKIIIHGHLGIQQMKKFPTLMQGLRSPVEQRYLHIGALKKDLELIKEKLIHSRSRDEKRNLGYQLKYLQLELRLLEISRKALNKSALFKELSELPKLPLNGTDFLEDINSLNPDTGEKKNVEGWSVVDTDDANDLLLMGTEIQGSCQRISGNASTNQCLIAYLVDGKNRLVAVKDEEGRLIGRVVLRMLWDGQKPVLFQEQLYVNHQNPLVNDLIEMMCIRRAESLGLDLYCSASEESEVRLSSFRSPAPYEYVDSIMVIGGQKVANGEFVLDCVKPIRLEG